MDTARYVLAVLTVFAIPCICVFWLLVHPFANGWRKIKPWLTYGILLGLFVSVIFILHPVRQFLIGTDYGFQPILAIAAVICFVVSVVIGLKRWMPLTNRIMVGYPEVSKEAYPGKILTGGIYGKIRHPRYVQRQLCFIGYALFANFLGVYIMTILLIPALYLIVLLEEKELIDRFGKDYVEYSKLVPRFFPRKGESNPSHT